MSYFWTVQSNDVIDIINKEGIYYPDFSKVDSVMAHREYRFLLDCYNNVNRTEFKGLVFGFAKKDLTQFNNVNELYDYLFSNPLISEAFNFWDDNHRLLQIEVDDIPYNVIPIDFNDYNQLTPPFVFGENYNRAV